MNRYHFRIYTGPTTVVQWSERLRHAEMPWQHVTIEGTEHVHLSIDALYIEAAERELNQWSERAGLRPTIEYRRGFGAELLRTEVV